MKKGRGFTLIELLVVISIIGLLASFVLVGLRNARLRARDANTQTALFEIRNAAEMSYTDFNDYHQVCDESDDTLSNSGEFGKIEEKILKYNGGQNVTCIEAADKESYAVSSPLVGKEGKHWCVCSVGITKELNHPTTNSRCE